MYFCCSCLILIFFFKYKEVYKINFPKRDKYRLVACQRGGRKHIVKMQWSDSFRPPFYKSMQELYNSFLGVNIITVMNRFRENVNIKWSSLQWNWHVETIIKFREIIAEGNRIHGLNITWTMNSRLRLLVYIFLSFNTMSHGGNLQCHRVGTHPWTTYQYIYESIWEIDK